MIIYCDNQGAIALAKNLESNTQNKYIDIQWHYQNEKIEDGSIEFKFIPSEKQIANGLTKVLTKEKFPTFRRALGLEEYRSLSESWLLLFNVLQRKCESLPPFGSTGGGYASFLSSAFVLNLGSKEDIEAR